MQCIWGYGNRSPWPCGRPTGPSRRWTSNCTNFAGRWHPNCYPAAGRRLFFEFALVGTEQVTKILAIVAALVTTISSARSLQSKQGLPILNQYAGWAILGAHSRVASLPHKYNNIPTLYSVFSVLLPIFTRAQTHTPSSKLQQYFLAFGPLFVLLSISTEGLFYASFSLTLYLWVGVESRLYEFAEKPAQRRAAMTKTVRRDRGWRAEALSRSMGEEPAKKPAVEDTVPSRQPRGLIGSDVRRAVFFLFFVQVAFFGAAKYVFIHHYT